MTSFIVWAALDRHNVHRRNASGVSSLYMAADSRITWTGGSPWDFGQKVHASRSHAVLIGWDGAALFPALVIPSLLARVDAAPILSSAEAARILKEGLLLAWNHYPPNERLHAVDIYIAHRVDGERRHSYEPQVTNFFVTQLQSVQGSDRWEEKEGRIPTIKSQSVLIGGSGAAGVQKEIHRWHGHSVPITSRLVFSAFADAVASGSDPLSGGSLQLAGLYRQGPGHLFGVHSGGERHFAGMPLVGAKEELDVEWRNSKFERVSGKSAQRLPGAQTHLWPPSITDGVNGTGA